MKYFILKITTSMVVAVSAVPFLKLAERYWFEYEVYDSPVLSQYTNALLFATGLITTAFWLVVWAFVSINRDEW
jgi:hypothetical protein